MRCLLFFACLLSLFVVAGCSNETAQTVPPPEQAETEADDLAAKERAEYEKAMAALSPEDRAKAEAQKNCPVGGPLGSMGTPYKITVKGREVFLCCQGCEDTVKADPDKYLAKLDAAADADADAATE